MLSLSGFAVAAAVGAWLEEVGWSGFAAHLLLASQSLGKTALLVGGVWAAWHLPALVEVGRTFTWIAGWALRTVAARVVLVWLYVHGGRTVIVPSLFHAASNALWQALLTAGVPFDPRGNAVLMLVLALIVLLLHRRERRIARPHLQG